MRRRRRGHTLVEMLVVFTLSAICLGILYQLYFGSWKRYIAVARKMEGEAAVRILLTRMRQELRHAIAPVVATDSGTTSVAIPLIDPRLERDDPMFRYWSKYSFDREEQTILYQKYPGDELDTGTPVEERFWLGGKTPVDRFVVRDSSERERILFQYYRVVVELSYFKVRIKDEGKGADAQRRPENLIHVANTVYPRRVNQELRIEVPQDGSFLN